MSEPILSVRNLKMHFDIKKGFFGRVTGTVKAVDDVSFDIERGETFGLVGESGCGKSTLGRAILRAYDPTAGEVMFSSNGGQMRDLAKLSVRELKPLRPKMQMIFQDPYSSLSPRMTIRDAIGEPMLVNKLATREQLDDIVKELLKSVGLNPLHLKRYPHAFSGGQRQRICVARALIMNPRFIVADEPVSALDVSIQAQILELLMDLKDKFDLTYLFISHDLSVIKYFCDRVAVMYVGKIVEIAETEELFRNPLHPYTEALTGAIPIPDPARRKELQLLGGEVADPASPPTGCYFHPRCKYAKERCKNEAPELRPESSTDDGHLAACHFAGELSLKSVLAKEGT